MKILEKNVGLAASSDLLKKRRKNFHGQEEMAETPEDLLAAADAALITSFKGAEFFRAMWRYWDKELIPRNLRVPIWNLSLGI